MIGNFEPTSIAFSSSDMAWKETLVEFRRIEKDNAAVMSLTSQARDEIASALSLENDERIIASFPPNIIRRESKELLYFGRYGEKLPDDFFE